MSRKTGSNGEEIIATIIGISLFVVPLIVLLFIGPLGSKETKNNTTNNSYSYSEQQDTFTLADAQKFIGKPLSDLCPTYSHHAIHITVVLEDVSGGEDCSNLHPMNASLIITRAFYDDEDGYESTPEEYRPRERTIHIWAEEK